MVRENTMPTVSQTLSIKAGDGRSSATQERFLIETLQTIVKLGISGELLPTWLTNNVVVTQECEMQ